MWRMLTPDSQRRISSASFANAYRSAAATATAVRLEPGKAKRAGDGARVPVRVSTRIFGEVEGTVQIPVVEERVDWRPELVFPGLRPGEALTRHTTAPRRARILDRHGRKIVSGPADARTPGDGAASSIAGSMGAPKTPAEQTALYARGFPQDAPVGTSGLERALEDQVAGRPGGELLAGSRRLAAGAPQRAHSVRSTIDLNIQAAADQALAGRFGGIAAIDPRSGKVRALAGIAFSAPQPPGSTFKMVTVTAALEHKVARPTTQFPVETKAIIDGVGLENANGESCGGNLVQSFAHSCNSVFAPLGVKIGAGGLVEAAERFGFNEPPDIDGEAPSTLPPASEIDTPLAVGSTAIGQGKVLATPLEMAVIAATFAENGVRHRPTLLEREEPQAGIRVTSRRIARSVERMMIDVVSYGTGTAASLAPISVAGKTGTAELGTTVGPTAQNPPEEPNTDAWFAAYAPTGRPKLAVGVLFVKAGAGGAVAAPAARVVLSAGVR
jgi:cell division protein FtsI/penicillin-binding protein 2